MFISKLLFATLPLAAVSASQTSIVLPRGDDDDDDGEPTTYVEPGDGLTPTVGRHPDNPGTKNPTDAPPAPSSVPTPFPPPPLESLAVGNNPASTDWTSTTATLATPISSLTRSSSSTTSVSFATVISLSSFSFSKYPTPLTSVSSGYSSLSQTSSAAFTATSSPSDTMGGGASQNGSTNDRTLIITLSTVLSVIGLVIVAISLYLCLRNRRRRDKLFNRGVTPIDDDEIATWKVTRNLDEKGGDRFTKRNSATSKYTHRKAPSNSVIQYQSQDRPSIEVSQQSPRSFGNKHSFEMPETLQTAVLARAPNARSGLTDETIPGDEPFVTSPRRQASKLYKLPPNSPPNGHRTRGSRGSRSSSMRSIGDAWYGENMIVSPRTSNDYHSANRAPSRVYSTSTAPPRVSFGENGAFVSLSDHEPLTTVLSPPPLHRTEIGRAIG